MIGLASHHILLHVPQAAYIPVSNTWGQNKGDTVPHRDFLGGFFHIFHSHFLLNLFLQFAENTWGWVFRESSDNFQLWEKGLRIVGMSLSLLLCLPRI